MMISNDSFLLKVLLLIFKLLNIIIIIKVIQEDNLNRPLNSPGGKKPLIIIKVILKYNRNIYLLVSFNYISYLRKLYLNLSLIIN